MEREDIAACKYAGNDVPIIKLIKAVSLDVTRFGLIDKSDIAGKVVLSQ